MVPGSNDVRDTGLKEINKADLHCHVFVIGRENTKPVELHHLCL